MKEVPSPISLAPSNRTFHDDGTNTSDEMMERATYFGIKRLEDAVAFGSGFACGSRYVNAVKMVRRRFSSVSSKRIRVRTCQSKYTQSNQTDDFVNFRLGQPSPRILANVSEHIARLDGPIHELALQYGARLGPLHFRSSLAQFMGRTFDFKEKTVKTDELLVTNGNSHAIQFLFRTFLNEGDEILVDGTYDSTVRA